MLRVFVQPKKSAALWVPQTWGPTTNSTVANWWHGHILDIKTISEWTKESVFIAFIYQCGWFCLVLWLCEKGLHKGLHGAPVETTNSRTLIWHLRSSTPTNHFLGWLNRHWSEISSRTHWDVCRWCRHLGLVTFLSLVSPRLLVGWDFRLASPISHFSSCGFLWTLSGQLEAQSHQHITAASRKVMRIAKSCRVWTSPISNDWMTYISIP